MEIYSVGPPRNKFQQIRFFLPTLPFRIYGVFPGPGERGAFNSGTGIRTRNFRFIKLLGTHNANALARSPLRPYLFISY